MSSQPTLKNFLAYLVSGDSASMTPLIQSLDPRQFYDPLLFPFLETLQGKLDAAQGDTLLPIEFGLLQQARATLGNCGAIDTWGT